jgi:hypothetical protein
MAIPLAKVGLVRAGIRLELSVPYGQISKRRVICYIIGAVLMSIPFSVIS